MKIIKQFLEALNGIKEALEDIKELRVVDSRFKDIDTSLGKVLIASGAGFSSTTIELQIDKDYFTKEFISKEQVDRETIYIIDGGNIYQRICRTGNIPKEVIKNNDKLYYFDTVD